MRLLWAKMLWYWVPNGATRVKGKIVDLLTDQAAAVVRYQGGHNAGHTLVVGGRRLYYTSFHQVFYVKTYCA